MWDTVGQGSDYVEAAGGRKHVMSYLGDFLFSPERARSPVRSLSGGERNRLLLARMFTRSANLLVLDEPTNDLDIETLELLESLLQAYAGTGRDNSAMHAMSAPLNETDLETIVEYYATSQPKSVLFMQVPCEDEVE